MRRELVALEFGAHYLEVKGVPAGRKKRPDAARKGLSLERSAAATRRPARPLSPNAVPAYTRE
jgi:hypothetical protein